MLTFPIRINHTHGGGMWPQAVQGTAKMAKGVDIDTPEKTCNTV